MVPLIWAVVATGTGLFLVSQSIVIVILVIGFATLGAVAVLTPVTALVTLLIIAPLRTLMSTEFPGQLTFDVGQLAFAGLLLCYSIHRIRQGQPIIEVKWAPLYVPLGVITAIGGLTALSATSLGAWLDEWLKWAQMGVVVALVMNMNSGHSWQWLVFGLVLAGTANAFVGVFEYLGGSGAPHLVINDHNFRAFGTFGQPNPFGGFMGLILPVALMSALGHGLRAGHQWRTQGRFQSISVFIVVFYFATSGILLAGLLASWSRGAWLGFAASLGAVAFAMPRKSWQSVSSLVLVGVTLFTLLSFGLLPQSILARITSTTEEYFRITDVRGVRITPENYPLVERLAHWQAALNMASNRPWLGVGQGNYEVVYPDYRLLNWPYPLGHAHNYYLNVLAEAGIMGLLGYGKVWLVILWLTWRIRKHPDSLARLVSIGLLGSWVYLGVHTLFDNLYVNNVFIHIGLMFGLLATLYNQVWYHRKVEL
jgi:O-antigen ligase